MSVTNKQTDIDQSPQPEPMYEQPIYEQPAPQQQPHASWSFHNGSMFNAPISRSVGSEFYLQLKNNLTEIYKQTIDKNVEISLIDLDNVNEPALAFSALIVALRYKNLPDLGVAYHILLLEATGDQLPPIIDTIGGQQVEVQRVTSDALDKVLLDKAFKKVKQAFPNEPAWYMVDGCVVPLAFDPNNKQALHRLALNACLADDTELTARSKDFKDLNLVGVKNDSILNINLSFNRRQLEDAVGAPMRSDVLVTFDSRKENQQNKYTNINTGDREVKISELSGFVDLVWSPMSAQSTFNPYAPVQQVQTQKYSPRLIITNLESNYSHTIGSILLALMTSLSVRDDNNWIQAFRPTPSSGKEIDMTDIGALNIEANLTNDPSGYGIRIDTKSDNFKLEDLGQLVSALIRPGMVISMDCPEVGPQSWYLSIFAAAANGSPLAYQAICESANQLTNGNFSKYFQMGTIMFDDLQNRVHNGYFTDKNGQRRDIRDIDHLAVCNLVGERDPQFIRDWADTFLRTNYPLALRLAARKKMLQRLTGETAVFTGFSQRVTFTSVFLEALLQGIKETGLVARVNTPLSGSEFSNQRGVANFLNSSLLAPGQSFAPSVGYAQQPMPGQFGYQNNWRY